MSEAIRVWRIVRIAVYAPDNPFVRHLSEDLKAWSGGAAAAHPGRWNILGQPVAYAAESRALAAWEVFIHSSVPELIAPDRHRIVCATFDPGLIDPRSIVDAPPMERLPPGWARKDSTKTNAPPSPSQELGHQLLIDGNALALRVPSVTIQGEFNYVINVEHPDLSQLDFSLWSAPARRSFGIFAQRFSLDRVKRKGLRPKIPKRRQAVALQRRKALAQEMTVTHRGSTRIGPIARATDCPKPRDCR